MGNITLENIKLVDNTIFYFYNVSSDISHFFKDNKLSVTYSTPINNTPASILTIPFVCNVLPIIWLTNSTLEIDEIDKAFFDCIPLIRDAYQKMFPESEFKGKIIAKKVIDNYSTDSNNVATFFSGGLDAFNTLLSHLDENPTLISIWGADIKHNNVDGWKKLYGLIEKSATQFNLNNVVIRSTFRDFDNEEALDATFSKQLKDGWWHGVKHSLGLIGHAAPYVYAKGITTLYIASSHCPLDEPVRCASHPAIDNLIKFANCSVVHDGYEMSRQDKVNNVVNLTYKLNQKISVKVCWVSASGDNCSQCEKCYRTIMALIAENADPVSFGFNNVNSTLPVIRQNLLSDKAFTQRISTECWTYIKNAFVKNKKYIRKSKYWQHVKWIYKFNFNDITKNVPISIKIRGNLSRYKFYQILHKIKVKLLRK